MPEADTGYGRAESMFLSSMKSTVVNCSFWWGGGGGGSELLKTL